MISGLRIGELMNFFGATIRQSLIRQFANKGE
jgi:hypothetical protein